MSYTLINIYKKTLFEMITYFYFAIANLTGNMLSVKS